MANTVVDTENVWIYHELQESLLCGQHALNNLAQGPVFSSTALGEIALQLDALELDVFAQNNEGGRNSREYLNRISQGSQHVNESGYFSLEVLLAAIQTKFGVRLIHSSQCTQDFSTMQGFLCHKSDHWFAIRKVGNCFWNLNSILERPQAITHFTLATMIEKWMQEGYTVYCATEGLPTGGIKLAHPRTNVATKSNWHRMSDLLLGKSTAPDPFANLSGKGMRLDGRTTTTTSTTTSDIDTFDTLNAMHVSDYTEEEQLQMALQESMQQQIQPLQRVVTATHVPPEPALGSVDAVRIQFKLPDRRLVRRFRLSDRVESLYAYCQEEIGNGKMMELRAGFPPKDLLGLCQQTIKEANLANESIKGRYL